MRIPRIYTPQSLATGKTILIEGNAAHHAINVLRLQTGSRIALFNGDGTEYAATLSETRRGKIVILIAEAVETIAEPVLNISLVQGIARNDRMDLILQKAVELGVTTIQPLWMQRSQKRLKGERMEKRMSHWEGVVINACEQSGRSTLPTMLLAETFPEWMGHSHENHLCIMLQPGATSTLDRLSLPDKALTLLAGPEGGLSPDEQLLAENSGYHGIQLGPRILRAETAGLAALAAAQVLWGDFKT